jgi:hypothetical protein
MQPNVHTNRNLCPEKILHTDRHLKMLHDTQLKPMAGRWRRYEG